MRRRTLNGIRPKIRWGLPQTDGGFRSPWGYPAYHLFGRPSAGFAFHDGNLSVSGTRPSRQNETRPFEPGSVRSAFLSAARDWRREGLAEPFIGVRLLWFERARDVGDLDGLPVFSGAQFLDLRKGEATKREMQLGEVELLLYEFIDELAVDCAYCADVMVVEHVQGKREHVDLRLATFAGDGFWLLFRHGLPPL